MKKEDLINRLLLQKNLTEAEFEVLIAAEINKPSELLLEASRKVTDSNYGRKIYFRGLIEMTNICKNNCYYCGIRRDNKNIHRYHMSENEILACCDIGYSIGIRTFVLQGGEDVRDTASSLSSLVSKIKSIYNDCAITLSLGEKSKKDYELLKQSGVDRYLLRHETACHDHYSMLHPNEMKLESRIRCLNDLKDLGFQVGAGFMVGTIGQSTKSLAKDLYFLQSFKPQMVGIGPFIPQVDTPFANEKQGSLNATLTMIALTRLVLPKALIPSTTALATIDERGRELGLLAGGNVLMPNLSPLEIRKDYALYDNKVTVGVDAIEGFNSLLDTLKANGFEPDLSRGDHLDYALHSGSL